MMQVTRSSLSLPFQAAISVHPLYKIKSFLILTADIDLYNI